MKYLNRDIRKIICIDYDPESLKYNPRNSVIIPKFEGDGTDRELLQLIPFMKG